MDGEVCIICNRPFILETVKYLKENFEEAIYSDSLYSHDCGTKFVMRYFILDDEGHINSDIFSEDLRNPKRKWQDYYTKEQLSFIESHLVSCGHCREVADNALIKEVEFNEFVELIKRRKNEI